MAMCKFCGKPFAWGQHDGGWVPLIPVGEEGDLPRTHQDENGVLRADHRSICTNRGGPAVRVVKLAKPVPAGNIIGWTPPDPDGVTEPFTLFKRKKRKPAKES